MATRTIADAGGNWSALATWVEGAVPTAADDVVATATSGTVTVNVTAACRSIDMTLGGHITFATTNPMQIGDASGGKLLFRSGMTLTRYVGAYAPFTFKSTSDNAGAGWDVDFAGKTVSDLVFNGAGGRWNIVAAFEITNGFDVKLQAGHLAFDAVTCCANSSVIPGTDLDLTGTVARQLSLGSADITMGRLVCTNATNLTVDANTATIRLYSDLVGGGVDYDGLNVVIRTDYSDQSVGNATIGSLAQTTPTSPSVRNLYLSGDLVVTGDLSFTGYGSNVDRHTLLASDVPGTVRTLTVNGTITVDHLDFQDIAAAGAGDWDLSALHVGDALGNTGITFPTARTLYVVSRDLNYWAQNGWSLTSGGASGQAAPLAHDDVIFDANTPATGTYWSVYNTFACRNLTAAGFTGTMQLAGTILGNLSIDASATLTSGILVLAGRGAQSFGCVPACASSVTVDSAGGTYTLTADLAGTSSTTLSVTRGGFVTDGFDVSVFSLASTGTLTRTLDIDGSTITLTAASTTNIWNVTATGLTFSATASLIDIANASTGLRVFNGGGLTYPHLRYTVTDSPGTVSIGNADTFGTLELGAGRVEITNTVTVIVDTWIVAGEARDYVQFPGLSSNDIDTPDHADFDITGDLTLIAKVRLADWTPTTQATLIGKWTATASTSSYRLSVKTDGTLELSIGNGTTMTNSPSTAATGVADGTDKWVKVTWRASDRRTQFFLSDDGSSWTQLGTDVTSSATITALAATTTVVKLGLFNTGSNMLIGRIYRAIIQSGIDGAETTVGDFDANSQVTGQNTYTDALGKTWTLTGNTLQAGDGRFALSSSSSSNAKVQHLGDDLTYTDDTGNVHTIVAEAGVTPDGLLLRGAGNLTAPDSVALSITGDIDIIAKVTMADWTPAARSYLIGKNGSYALSVETGGQLRMWIGIGVMTGVNSSVATGLTNDTAKWIRATWRNSDDRVQFFTSDDGSSWTQLGTDQTLSGGAISDSSNPLEIGAIGSGGRLTGTVHRVIVKNGIAGTAVLDADFENAIIPAVGGMDYMRITDVNAIGFTVHYAGANSVDGGDTLGWTFTDAPGGTLDKTRFGADLVDAALVGAGAVSKMYVGADQVWP